MPYETELAAIGVRADAELSAQKVRGDVLAADRDRLAVDYLALKTKADGLAADLAKVTTERDKLLARPAPVTPPPISPADRVYPGYKRVFFENFDKPSLPGRAYVDYVHAIAGYGDSGPYRINNVSVHDGLLDLAIPGGTAAKPSTGAVVVVGNPLDRWAWLYGQITVKFKAEGATGTGAALMLWGSNNATQWEDGEVDFAEGKFGGNIETFVHPTPCTSDRAKVTAAMPYCGLNSSWANTGRKWTDWNELRVQWEPGRLNFYCNDELYHSTVKDVPTTKHRLTMQVADPQKGGITEPGRLLIDYVRIDALA